MNKNVLTIAPDLPFLDVLAEHIWNRANKDGFALSKFMVFLPTRRACRLLGFAFARLAGDRPVLLPRMRPLGDIDEDELAFSDSMAPDARPPVSISRRLALLMQQVKRRDQSLSWDQAALASEALATFLDMVEISSCDLGLLPELVEEQELAEHWAKTLGFLEIVTKTWPLILQDEGCEDRAVHRNKMAKMQADAWRIHPPDFPVIAAGSTGSVPSTAELLDVIAGLKEGAVVLPGLDLTDDAKTWNAVEDTHPQHSMKMLLKKMGVCKNDVRDLLPRQHPQRARVTLLNEAMRPADLTDAWRDLRGKLDRECLAGLRALTADHPQEEAQVIALRLRAFLETPDKSAVFVTADKALAARVSALLKRWDINIDDSGGVCLLHLPVGSFLSLILRASRPSAKRADFMAVLKHPLAACGLTTAACRAKTRAAEIRLRKTQDDDFSFLSHLLRPLTDAWRTPASFADCISLHIRIAETVAATDCETGASRLWEREYGEDVAAWLDEWKLAVSDFPDISGNDYMALFDTMANMKTVRSGMPADPRLSILGPLEARLCHADLVILGGMNEGSWPPDAGFDPWLSRPMRKKLGLPSPEFRIGQSAHDFVQLACANEVLLTRSIRSNGTPTVPSRFWLQIDAVLRASGLNDDGQAMEPEAPWRAWAHALDAPLEQHPCARPRPCPALSARPKTLSVTEISTWIRNPYGLYAKRILNLEKLDDLDSALDASDRGTMIHKALEKFTREYPLSLPDNAYERLCAIARDIFSKNKEDPRVRAFWEARFADIAKWFVERERVCRDGNMDRVIAEAEGILKIGEFTLKGRADRIELLKDGSINIIDYKTGRVPTAEEVKSGIEPQLQLLALLAQQGGFKNIPQAQAGVCAYWEIKGGDGKNNVRSFDQVLPELVKNAEAGLKSLIELFNDPATVYEAIPRPRLRPKYDDYVHLSRVQEWARAGGDL